MKKRLIPAIASAQMRYKEKSGVSAEFGKISAIIVCKKRNPRSIVITYVRRSLESGGNSNQKIPRELIKSTGNIKFRM